MFLGIKNEGPVTELAHLGWNDEVENNFKPYRENGMQCGRVSIENRDNYLLLTEKGEFRGEVTGKLLFESDHSSDLPKVGDWVVITPLDDEKKAIIHDILPRRTKLSRKVAGEKTTEQVMASNIDIVFIVQSLDANFNLKRLERYLVMVGEGGCRPVVVLNKTDLCDNVQSCVDQVKSTALDVNVIPVSAATHFGMDHLKNVLSEGLTFAFVGSSGVGKSSLINAILGGASFQVNEVREKDSKGRHTTTRREMVHIPGKGLLIDTPGMRELALWDSATGMEDAFSDFSKYGESCHFPDCSHTHEKGCGVLQAVEEGTISPDRYESYIKLQKELAYLNEKQTQKGYLDAKKKWKPIHKAVRQFYKSSHKYNWKNR